MSHWLSLCCAALCAALLLFAWSGNAEQAGWLAQAAEDDPFGEKPKAQKPAAPAEDPFAPAAATAEKPAPEKSAEAKPAEQKKSKAPAKHLPTTPQAPGGIEAFENVLAQPTEVQFVETPLQDVIDFLQDKHKVNILLDKKALNDLGVDAATPVTLNLRGVSLRQLLDLLLRDLGLTWTIRDGVLMITSPDEAQAILITKVYDVADLVTCEDEKGAQWEDYQALIDAITSTIDPSSWDVVGGAGSINGQTFGSAKVVVVTQPFRVHEQIADLLKQIRDVAQKNPDQGPPRRDRHCPVAHGSMGAMSGMGGMGGGMGSMGGAAPAPGTPSSPQPPAGTPAPGRGARGGGSF